MAQCPVPMQYPFDLVVVVPVYNEAECIAGVLRSWLQCLDGLAIRCQILALNDGSRDATSQQLEQFVGDPRIQIVNKQNAGHGPTILQGYRMAVDLAPWVFQCDSDDEMRAEHFPRLWHRRNEFDAIFGIRAGRQQPADRRIISAVSRALVRLLFGRGVVDVNTPYRLMRSSCLRQIVVQIPADTFAPNIIISGTFARAKLRIWNEAVPHEGRRTGQVSIMKWKLWKAASRAFRQTLCCRPRLNRACSSETDDKSEEISRSS